MIEPMAKVRLVAPRTLGDRVTALLQDAGVLHIESTPTEAAQIPLRPQVMDEPARQHRAELERLRDELHRLLLLLPETRSPISVPRSPSLALPLEGEGKGEGGGQRRTEPWKRIAQFVRQIGSRVDYLTGRLKVCEDELALLSKYERAIEALAPFLRLLKESDEIDHLGVTIEEEARHARALPLLHEMMAKVTDNRYELFHSRLDERTLAVLLVFPRTHTTRLRSLLWEEGITELRLPASVSEKPLAQALRVLLKKKADLPARASRYRAQLADVARTWREDLLRYHDTVSRRLEQIEAAASFYQTELATIIYGWVPSRALGALRGRLEQEFGGRVVLEECPVHRAEWGTVPVVLNNPLWLKPFESLTRLIALPRYGSIDPTPYLAVFFPLFYGMILGDVGYGLLVLIAATVVRRRSGQHPLIHDLAFVLMVASGAAVLFGFLFGELFGELGAAFGLHPLLDRMEAFIPLLYLSIGIGAGHVCLGILLGAFGAWRQGDRHECLAKVGGLGLVSSFVVLIGGLSGLFPPLWAKVASAGFAASLALALAFGGARGALELHNLVNVLSYLRLMGIGVASAALAFAANTLGHMAGHVLLAVVIGVTLHAINLVFGLLSPTIQSLRLHYVEFFENFFAAGGKPYRPFKRSL